MASFDQTPGDQHLLNFRAADLAAYVLAGKDRVCF
jgi:hypothetical protein